MIDAHEDEMDPGTGGTLPIDMEWSLEVLFQMLRIPSPSGRTDAVMQYVGDVLTDLGLPFRLTRRGSLLAELPGRSESVDRALVVHADTIGCMVRALKPNGRLELAPVGTFSARFAEGARVKVFAEDPDRTYSGTVMPLKASGHAFGDEIDTQGIGWEHVEVRVDELANDEDDLARLGIQVGDFVALDATPELTDAGFLVSRHLDGKAGVAAALAAVRAIVEGDVVLPHRASLLVTIAEEIGQGASHGLDADVAEMVSVDNAVCAPGQQSIEDGVTIPMGDMTGPFDYHLTRRLCRLCRDHDLPYARDLFRWYRSDVAAALEAGAGTRAALVAFGLDGSHGWERTHVRSIEAVAQLLTLWLQTPLTFARWDAAPTGALADFPSGRQPAPTEQWGRLADE
ncbi:osmoprotectant NAGGN system M42 family peptidase [Iamia majanohamensis]|uniref:Osmoprotectant NAGGN system M42 family peptidase n=2 Tax=Iamia majanohamensis TaxID=467976 RepID=A0AAE9Y3G5_9ACTN|nr:osmoprotectant NAGGN system M42 family peptidase [Iamia majanohamensis]WCO65780.1 osmoprotectant NAGGN system M42 family peptidase [Iamia majanohamensis]